MRWSIPLLAKYLPQYQIAKYSVQIDVDVLYVLYLTGQDEKYIEGQVDSVMQDVTPVRQQ